MHAGCPCSCGVECHALQSQDDGREPRPGLDPWLHSVQRRVKEPSTQAPRRTYTGVPISSPGPWTKVAREGQGQGSQAGWGGGCDTLGESTPQGVPPSSQDTPAEPLWRAVRMTGPWGSGADRLWWEWDAHGPPRQELLPTAARGHPGQPGAAHRKALLFTRSWNLVIFHYSTSTQQKLVHPSLRR